MFLLVSSKKGTILSKILQNWILQIDISMFNKKNDTLSRNSKKNVQLDVLELSIGLSNNLQTKVRKTLPDTI